MKNYTAKNTLGPIDDIFLQETYERIVQKKLELLGTWAKRTIEALPQDQQNATGYRDLRVLDDGSLQWEHPRSNSAERIEAFIWLSEKLKDSTYLDMAKKYADSMIDDPIRGIYQGPEEEGSGHAWYWPDFGLYMTNYTMRIPPAMLELYKKSGNEKYQKAALLSAEQLLLCQKKAGTGIPIDGWIPTKHIEGVEFDPEKAKSHVRIKIINSRIGYIALTFASMYKATNSIKYKQALEYFITDFQKYQNSDGSFPQDLHTDKIEVYSETVKGHFHSYILNGITKAAILMPEMAVLREIAVKLGDYIVHQNRQCWGHPYINIHNEPQGAESGIWHSSSPEIIAGLAWLTKLTGNKTYLQVAKLTAIDALLRVFDCPEEPNLHGAFPLWLNKNIDHNQQTGPYIGGWFHFGLILGIKVIEESKF